MKEKKPDKNWAEMTKTEEMIHKQTILVEALTSDFKLVIEKVDGMEGRLGKRIIDTEKNLSQKMDDMQGALTLRIENVRLELKEEIQKVGRRVDVHETEIQSLKQVVGIH